jgi:hypothetical protein
MQVIPRTLTSATRFDKCQTFVAPELVLQHPELATYSDASLSTRCYTVNCISFEN